MGRRGREGAEVGAVCGDQRTKAIGRIKMMEG